MKESGILFVLRSCCLCKRATGELCWTLDQILEQFWGSLLFYKTKATMELLEDWSLPCIGHQYPCWGKWSRLKRCWQALFFSAVFSTMVSMTLVINYEQPLVWQCGNYGMSRGNSWQVQIWQSGSSPTRVLRIARLSASEKVQMLALALWCDYCGLGDLGENIDLSHASGF